MTRKEIAEQFAKAFELKERDNGDSFYTLRDGSPEWMQEAIFAAHDNGEMLPNDWSYWACAMMADAIDDYLRIDPDAELSDCIAENADALIPAYNAQRTDWLASHTYRALRVDDAVAEYGWPNDGGIFQAIAYGIHSELSAVGHAIASAIEDQADDES